VALKYVLSIHRNVLECTVYENNLAALADRFLLKVLNGDKYVVTLTAWKIAIMIVNHMILIQVKTQ
jgi:hypothetical protein